MSSDDAGAAGDAAFTIRTGRLRPDVPVVQAGGHLDRSAAPQLRHLIDAQIAASPWAIVLDLSALSVVEQDAVPTLVRLAERAAEADVGFYLVSPGGPDGSLSHVLATAAVLDLFEIHPTIDSALQAMSRDL
jgi:anti-anti-sigma factor